MQGKRLRVKDVAAMLHRTPETVYRTIKRGDLRAHRPRAGASLWLNIADVEVYQQRLEANKLPATFDEGSGSTIVVGELLGVAPTTVRRLIEANSLKATREGHDYGIKQPDLEEYLGRELPPEGYEPQFIDLLTPKEVRDLLNLEDTDAVYYLCRSKQLAHTWVLGSLRVTRKDLESYLGYALTASFPTGTSCNRVGHTWCKWIPTLGASRTGRYHYCIRCPAQEYRSD